jgi:hypothetical protein
MLKNHAKKLLLLLILATSYLIGNSQKISISGAVFNSKDKKCIPYVNIHIIGSNFLIDTDENGRFKVDVNPTDTLLFTCIGYDIFSIDVNKYGSSDSIFLNEKVYILENVVVTNTTSKEIGIINNKQTRSFAGESLSESYEIATLIEIPNTINSYRISKIMFKQKNYSSDMPLRLHIYSVQESGLPGEDLLKKQVIIVERDYKNGNLEIDIKDQNIILEKASFFVGLQWITKSSPKLPKGIRNDVGIGETNALNKRLTFRRGRVLNYKWYIDFEKGVYIPDNENGKVGTTPIPLKGNPINILASVVIETL